ncbi:2OG-Fe(II) oxygenase [Cupriavidus sp. CV2]|uniref:2OG-Fe(II) oxygenase n=1 Tax=Cupriavidus ulmosensis TaxID=3065913 RepID=UPI00296A9C4B|nr:2OG-Fe(II) oxygenase [Cupriavidus sp. CV2]MDW3688256.1 2OG-Fe(II) oxygenase [Cupriavidus sp. CV2]
MHTATHMIDRLDWPGIAAQLDMEGYAVLPGLLTPEQARALGQRAGHSEGVRRVSLASGDLGRGDFFYFAERLPSPLATWREAFYRHLAPIANSWNEALDAAYRYPAELDDFLERNRQAGQTRTQSNLSRLREDDYLALHQRDEGEHVFPLQLVALLGEPGTDFTGGEFVMTEQRPRMQSRPMVLPLKLGDAAIISTAQRPCKGSKGYYRVNLKHAISRVRGGERLGLELSLHDAP